ncbi:hypothetical protein M1512_03510 [Patescibacteria group bacterium]|jgi:hypothetical protein|nr:hypothetical protein [Patescibacteria group bacterium]
MGEIEKNEGLRPEEATEFLIGLNPDYQRLIGQKIPGQDINFEDFGQLCKGAEALVRGFNAATPGSFEQQVAKAAIMVQFGEHLKGMLD